MHYVCSFSVNAIRIAIYFYFFLFRNKGEELVFTLYLVWMGDIVKF